MLSRRNGLPNSRRHRRMHRQLQVHRFSPGLRHSSRPVDQRNQVHQCLGRPLNNHLPVCRLGRRECLRPARREQLLRAQLLRRH